MRKHALETILALKSDREQGLSIPQLMNKYSLPKTTIWHHVKGVVLTKRARALARSNQGGSKLRSQQSWDQAETKAILLLKNFDESIIWPILFSALYWSEGTKKSGFVFTNTDEFMIRVFLKILRKHLRIKNGDLDILIRTCTPMNPLECRRHWSVVTDIPHTDIKINHNNEQNRSKTRYGICRITLKKGGFNLKLMHCLIQEITAKILKRPRSSTDRTSHS